MENLLYNIIQEMILEKEFQMITYRTTRAYYGMLYMRRKEELQTYQKMYEYLKRQNKMNPTKFNEYMRLDMNIDCLLYTSPSPRDRS